MASFSDIAVKEMIALSSDTKNKVGRELYRAEPKNTKDILELIVLRLFSMF